MQSLVADGKAYIRNADGRAEFHDIMTDAAELHDLAGSADAPTLLRLRETVKSLFDETRPK
ncbi:MAG: hypothetical protein ACLP7Q_04520 [Isosphaeraceae bacterium]